MFKINIINFEDILYRLFTLGKRLMGASTSLVTYWNSVQINSSVIRPKGKYQNQCFKKTKNAKILRKTNISYVRVHIKG